MTIELFYLVKTVTVRRLFNGSSFDIDVMNFIPFKELQICSLYKHITRIVVACRDLFSLRKVNLYHML